MPGSPAAAGRVGERAIKGAGCEKETKTLSSFKKTLVCKKGPAKKTAKKT